MESAVSPVGVSASGGHPGLRRRGLKPLPPRRPKGKDGIAASGADSAHAPWPGGVETEAPSHLRSESAVPHLHVGVAAADAAVPAGSRSYADVAAGNRDASGATCEAPAQHHKPEEGEGGGVLLPGQAEEQEEDGEAYAGPVLVRHAPLTRDWGAGLWGRSGGKSLRQRAPFNVSVSVHTPMGSQEGHTPATRESYSALIPELSTPPCPADGVWFERRVTPRGATPRMGTPLQGSAPSYLRQRSGGSSGSSRSGTSRLRPLPPSTRSGRAAHLGAQSLAPTKPAEALNNRERLVPPLSLSPPASPVETAPRFEDALGVEEAQERPPKPEDDEDDYDCEASIVSSSEGEDDIPEKDRGDSLQKMNEKHVEAKLKVEKLLNAAEEHEEQILHTAHEKGGKGGRKKRKEEEESAIEVLKVCVGTWNMGGKPCPDDVNLNEWLPKNECVCARGVCARGVGAGAVLWVRPDNVDLNEWLPKNEYDVYVIGVQECEAAAGLSSVQERPKWEGQLNECVGDGYTLLAKHCLGTTHLSCFVKKSKADECSDVHIAHVITGFGQVVANKAGIGLCFDFRHTSFLFVTAHFAAHMHKVHARNQDFRRIDTGLLPLMCPEIARMYMPRRASSAMSIIWPSSVPPSLPFTASQRPYESLASNNQRLQPSPVSISGAIHQERTLMNVPSKDSMRTPFSGDLRTSSGGIPVPACGPEGGQRSVSADIPRADDMENRDGVSELSASAPLPPLSAGLLSSGLPPLSTGLVSSGLPPLSTGLLSSGFNSMVPTPTSVGSMFLSPSSASQKEKTSVSAHFDRVFWMGDFNYRIAQTRDWVDAKLVECEEKGDMHQLLLFDQLNVEKANFAVFQGFEEPVIRFRPTYKYDVNSDSYDTSKKRRVPAWTDRILFKYKADQADPEQQSIRSMKYKSVESIKASDHRPVVGCFEVDVPRNPEEIQEKREARGARDKGSAACAIL